MRVASSQYQSTMNRSLQLNQERITFITQQMASGNRIQVPSDDPIGNVRMSRLNREEALVKQYKENITSVQTRLSKNEVYLTSTVNDMTQARDLLVLASDGSNTTADLNAAVSSLTALRDSVFYNANLKDQEGRYMFSGTMTATAPLSLDANAAAGARYGYAGNTDSQVVVVGNGITQASNVNVGGIENWLNQIDAAIEALASPTAVANDPALRTVLATALDGTDAALELVAGKIAMLGGAQNILDTLNSNLENVSLSNKMALHDIGQTDMGTAATELNGYTAALEATYKAYAKIGNLSLFDVL